MDRRLCFYKIQGISSFDGVRQNGCSMIFKRNHCLQLLSLLLILTTAGNGYAQDKASLPDPQAFSKPYGHHLAPILEHIQASSTQRSQITSLVMSYRSKIEPLRNLYRQKSQEFLTCVVKGDTADLIISKQLQLGQLYADITSQYCLMSLAVRKLLKPEQIVLYEEYKKQQGWTRK